MNPKALNTARPAPRLVSQKDKDLARQSLMLADKFLKDGDFVKARAEVGKAQKLDPSNPYAYAFLDRITYFEEQVKKKEAHKKDAEEAEKRAEEEAKRQREEVARRAEEEEARKKEEEAKKQREAESQRKAEEEARRKEEEHKKKAEEEARKKAEEEKKKAEEEGRKKAEGDKRKAEEEARKKAEEERQKAEAAKQVLLQQPKKPEETDKQPPAAKPQPPLPRKPGSLIDAARPLIAEMLSARSKPEAQKNPSAPAIADMLEQVSSHHSATAPKGDIDVKLDEMRRQIEMLTKALDQERKVREEMNQQQIKGAIKQLRSALAKAWVNGVPKDSEVSALHEMAMSLGITEDVEQTITREVKLDMYSRAVKEVVAKHKLLRNSSRTLEWLRDVYKVTIAEYLEYESKFLMDLVADQYKGTILLVTGEEKIAAELGQRLKSMGYAVVNAVSPENALEKIEKINPHYVLCDMEFAGGALSGIKFLHVLRASSKFSYVPFIMLCQSGDVTQLRSSELRSTEGYVEKPIEMEKLNQVMNEKLAAFRQYLSSL